MERKIALDRLTCISGGQTGIDRAVLDFCMDHGVKCGGWCPEGRQAEDGPIDARYPVKELPGASYGERTRANVAGSDATVILCHGKLSGGTLKSREFARELTKPLLELDLKAIKVEEAVWHFSGFIHRIQPSVVNFSGPRQSEWSQGYDLCLSFLQRAFRE